MTVMVRRGIPNFQILDDDGDGIDTALEDYNGSNIQAARRSDLGWNIRDYLDVDDWKWRTKNAQRRH
jgi:hypothetical protein